MDMSVKAGGHATKLQQPKRALRLRGKIASASGAIRPQNGFLALRFGAENDPQAVVGLKFPKCLRV
jgi:hypothetical protein